MFGKGNPRCGICNDFVYQAEEVAANGQKYHQMCFKCKQCRKALESTNLTPHKADLYCKSCHSKLFGPRGFRAGAGGVVSTGIQDPAPVNKLQPSRSSFSRAISTTTQASSTCPSCKAPFSGGKFCSECGHRVATPTAASAPQQPVRSNAAIDTKGIKSKFEGSAGVSKSTESPSVGGSRPKSKFQFGGAPKCGRCGKSVYAAEKVIGAGQSWHNSCFKCETCNKSLDSTTLRDREKRIFCNACYGKNFGPKGFGYGVGAGALCNTGK